MINRIKNFIENIKEIWKVAQKPSQEELKRILYTTLLLFAIITLISLAIFILVQYLLYIWQFM
ncbi:MAG: protein translocase SEC61 complex subunit gamma [Nanopusillaceae archaeon]